MKIPITWIPEHPSYGSFSMLRYWKFLAQECLAQDAYDCKSILSLPDEATFSPAGKGQRVWSRKVTYPLQIQRLKASSIVHVLDHSWAEMLAFVPKGVRKVATLHDLIPLRDATGLSPTQLERFRHRVSYLRQADAVIADSSYTRDEAMEWLQLDPERVFVIPCGVDFPRTELRPRESAEQLRIGSLGSNLARKNLGIFAPALRAYRGDGVKPPLLIRAGERLDALLAEEIKAATGAKGFQELGKLSEAGLEDFYASLDVLVVPSYYEGFGLPVLEAMAHGVPVIAANTSSLPEVGGDAALYFDPNDSEELAERLREVADPARAEALRSAGLERAKGFSWRATLEGFYKVYDQVLGVKSSHG